MKRIATHRKPDADAVVSIWLVQRYLFAGEAVEIIFLSRSARFSDVADCLVDVSNVFDAQRLIFDHKPPAFTDRNLTCATKLVWEHLVFLGKPVEHLALLVQVMHEGDRNPPGKASEELIRSRTDGLHARITSTRALNLTDHEFYSTICTWLDAYDANSRRAGNL
ncbi:MAG TPA: hypothetical protein VF600_04770 [Abditibacteriaceae bacterium]|jgi:hypothetical protein